jgi:hypothetical protein
MLLFMEATGFFRPTFTMIVELHYQQIVKVLIEASHRLTLTDAKGHKYSFTSFRAVSAAVIAEDLKSLMAPLNYHRFG